jgi:SagB-type dehydrogenase family enzyme
MYALLSRALPSHLPIHARQTDIETFQVIEYTSATRPGCPVCSIRPGDVRPTGIAPRYEAAVGIPIREYADLKSHQNHYKPANHALQKQFRTWPACPRHPLPDPDLSRLDVPFDNVLAQPNVTRPGEDQDLSLLLLISAGIQQIMEKRVNRWTAAGGNIGSVHAYAIVRNCPGISPGVYAYLEKTHELALMAVDPTSIPGDAPITIVLSGDFAKVASKYGSFGLRVTLQDGGCALTSLLVVARALGLDARPAASWPAAAYVDALSIDANSEAITSVTEIWS